MYDTTVNTQTTFKRSRSKKEVGKKNACTACIDGFLDFLWFFYADIVNRTYIYTAFLVHVWDSGSDLGKISSKKIKTKKKRVFLIFFLFFY